jgi:hypothetical protein
MIMSEVKAIMQVLTNRLARYNMQLLTTNCLNTAVMVVYLLLGSPALLESGTCDTDVVAAGVDRHGNRSPQAVKALAEDVLRAPGEPPGPGPPTSPPTGGAPAAPHGPGPPSSDRRCQGSRVLYYVMVTDGCVLPTASTAFVSGSGIRAPTHTWAPWGPDRCIAGALYFPGHVFVIEKLGTGYRLYQSYVEQYDLAGHVKHNAGSLDVSARDMGAMMRGLVRMMTVPVWDAQTTAFWRLLTHVDASAFEGRDFGDSVFLCYRVFRSSDCLSTLRTLVRDTLEELDAPALSSDRAGRRTYGDATRYAAGTEPLTNAQVREAFRRLAAGLATWDGGTPPGGHTTPAQHLPAAGQPPGRA